MFCTVSRWQWRLHDIPLLLLLFQGYKRQFLCNFQKSKNIAGGELRPALKIIAAKIILKNHVVNRDALLT